MLKAAAPPLPRWRARSTSYTMDCSVIEFYDIHFDFSSRFTREMRAVAGINSGGFGDGVELVRDRNLSWNSNLPFHQSERQDQASPEASGGSISRPPARRRLAVPLSPAARSRRADASFRPDADVDRIGQHSGAIFAGAVGHPPVERLT